VTGAEVVGGLFFNQVSAGGAHSCGKTSQGRTYCWGGNSAGQLGTGTTENSPVPVPVAGPM
jgi:alpha-tubulin suppressor-like RCC1 family protein